MITHYDLFAGIGGFSLALDEVFYDQKVEHIFCEWEQFPTAVLKQHWPDGEYWGDIADLVDHTKRQRLEGHGVDKTTQGRQEPVRPTATPDSSITIVTGGFPCQPFSAAGRKRGTADDRYKWPEMFEVIRNVKPAWVIAENVRGLATWNEGMVLEQVCADLENEGYEVQPLIIPAVAVNAPHRRERVWIVAYAERYGQPSRPQPHSSNGAPQPQPPGPDNAKHTKGAGNLSEQAAEWQRDWREVAVATCNDSMDDGLPRNMDGVTISHLKWRGESLKAYGNAIVPQVAVQIIRSIREAT